MPAKDGLFDRYGLRADDNLTLELFCYLHNRTPEQGGLGRADHLRNATTLIWGKHNRKKHCVIHPWWERMNEAACQDEVLPNGEIRQQRYLGISGCGASGKCLAPNTPVLMFDGSIKKASEVSVGDQLMGDDSTPRSVLSTNTGRSNMVRIIPNKGDTWECNDDHVLTLKRAWAGMKARRRVGEIIDISVKDFLASTKTWKRTKLLFRSPVEFQEQPIEFDPQIYGIWLGDGTTNRPHITIHDDETAIRSFVVKYFKSCGYNVAVRYWSNSRCGSYMMRQKCVLRSPFLTFTRESSPNGEKRILKRYLFNSRENRLRLLAGIIDSDGSTNGTCFEISSKLDGLTEDIAFLARSLGFLVTVKKRTTKCQNGKVCPSNRIRVMGKVWEIPTLRKIVRRKKCFRSEDCTGFRIEQIGEGDWAGFTLDGNGRFLLGDFTVTHNSDYGAIYALLNWMADPINTLVLCTSTDLKASRLRVWGRIMSYFEAIPEEVRPGVLVSSQGVIVTTNEKGKKLSDESGICLIAGDKKREREAIGKIIGAHNKRVIFIADELPELSEALLEAAYSNLATNPFFQMLGLGNFKSRYDSFGQFVAPKLGYDSVTVDDDEWETERGYCIRLDGMKSPNLAEEKDLWPIYGRKQLAAHKKDLGENSAGFWRMCRSFEAPIGLDDAIYSESDLLAGDAYGKVIWLTPPTKWTSLDPSFTNGGDRAIQTFGSYGTDKNGAKIICFERQISLREDVRVKAPRDYQIARQFRDNAVKEGIKPKHAAMDTTGAGSVLWSIVAEEWSDEVLRVDFSGAPSELYVTPDKTSKQSYDRKVSEIWYVGKEFLKCGQLKGVSQEMAREMKARKFDTVKGTEGLKIRVEPKKDMKTRLLFSPDLADSGFVGIHLCRTRLGAIPNAPNTGRGCFKKRFFELAKQRNSVYETLYQHAED